MEFFATPKKSCLTNAPCNGMLHCKSCTSCTSSVFGTAKEVRMVALVSGSNKINTTNEEINFVSENFKDFNLIFDAAAMGQYLGGIDPKNDSSNTIGFVNETCVIKYNNYKFFYNVIDNIKKPFLLINNIPFRVFNLHIHSKNLKNFM